MFVIQKLLYQECILMLTVQKYIALHTRIGNCPLFEWLDLTLSQRPQVNPVHYAVKSHQECGKHCNSTLDSRF